MRKAGELKKYKFHLKFKGGNNLIFETNTDIRTAERNKVNGGLFVDTENNYTINLAQLESLNVKILH
ncbi:hypothetical protein MKY37_05195 [Psychrobacillus sp. FSL K6-2836]|uniref:hypothetical protein n=1 Tax=Psychrobacillus sp. FSL K6-2836 TaxID=2921548 RepID=UPI0030F850EB